MSNKFQLINNCFLFFILIFFSLSVNAGLPCSGKIPNPVTDVCWQCMFPINIGGIPITSSGQVENWQNPEPPLICSCPAPPPLMIRLGVGVSFWEPARIAEVVRSPMCSPTLDGTVLGSLPSPAGGHKAQHEGKGIAFYNVHWFQYPVLSWLGMAFVQAACASSETFDMMYLTEVDPLWNDDETTFLMNPEAALFTSPVTQAACVADTVSAATTNFGIDKLFWCSGSQGGVYPIDGNQAQHVGAVDTTLAITHKFIFKLHRQFLELDTSTIAAMCAPLPQPILRKGQYKQQMMYPIPQTTIGLGLGVPSSVWAAGKEYPYKGEDFSYLIWRKRTCCAF